MPTKRSEHGSLDLDVFLQEHIRGVRGLRGWDAETRASVDVQGRLIHVHSCPVPALLETDVVRTLPLPSTGVAQLRDAEEVGHDLEFEAPFCSTGGTRQALRF